MQRRSLALGWVIAVSALVSIVSGACSSSSSSSDSAAAPPVAVRPDSGQCTRACCELPQPGQACDPDAGASTSSGGTSSGSSGSKTATCTYAVTCAEGLVLSRSVSCQSGRWTAINDCPAPGSFDGRGCPSAQPQPGTPCSLDAGAFSCAYSKKCAATICDGSDCAAIHSSASAQCVQGTWQTTPLGPC